MAVEIIVGAILGYFTLWITFFPQNIDSFQGNTDGDTKEDESNGSQFLKNSIHDFLYGYENADTLSNVSLPNLALNDDGLESIFSNRETKRSNVSCQMQPQVDEENLNLLSDTIVNASKDKITFSNGGNQIERFDYLDEENDLINDGSDERIIKYLDDVSLLKVSPNSINWNWGNNMHDDNFSSSMYLINKFKDLSEDEIVEKNNQILSTDKECVFAATSQNTVEIPCKENIYDLTSVMVPVDKIISLNEEISCQSTTEKNKNTENSAIISESNKVFLQSVKEQVTEIVNLDTTIETLIKWESIDETDKKESCDLSKGVKLQQKCTLNKDLKEQVPENTISNQANFDYLVNKKEANIFCEFQPAGFVKKPLEQSTPPNIGVRDGVSDGNLKKEIFMKRYPSRGMFSKDLKEKVSSNEFGHTSKNTRKNIWEPFSGIELKDLKLRRNEAVGQYYNSLNDVMDDIAENSANEATKATSQHFSRNKNDAEFSSDSESFEASSNVSINSEVNVPYFSKYPHESSINLKMEGNQAEGYETAMAPGNIDSTQPKSTFKEKCSFPKKLKNFFTKTVQKPFKSLRVSTKKVESQQKDPDLSLLNCEVSSDKSDFTFEPGSLLLRYPTEDPFDNKSLERRSEMHVSTIPNAYGANGQISKCTRQKPCVKNKKHRDRENNALCLQGILNEGKKLGVSRKRFEPKKWFMKKLTPHAAI